MLSRNFALSFAAALVFTGTLSAQNDNLTAFTLQYRIAGTATQAAVVSGSTLALPDTNVGTPSSGTLLITSASSVSTDYSVGNLVVTGAGFTGTATPTVPMRGGGFGSVTFTFAPAASGPVNGSLQFTLTSANGQQFPLVFSLFGNGLAPKTITSYISAASGNQLPVQSGATIPLPNTAVGLTGSTTFAVSNVGTGSTTVDSVSIAGTAFSLSGLSLTPATLNAAATFQFQIAFAPAAAQSYAGSLQVSIGGKANTFTLQGQGTSAALTYKLLNGSGSLALNAGGAITLPDTPADGTSTSTVTAQVTNSGNQDTALSAVNVTGAGFSLANLPVLPATLKANGGTALFNIVFQPASPGPATGRLQIGNDVFTLTGNGLGAQLTFSANVGTGSLPLASKGTVAVPNTPVGSKRTVSIAVTNAGNQSATVSSFSVSGAAFSVVNPTGLPVTLASGQTQTLQFVFTPTTVGQSTGTLAINDQTFSIVAAGDPPAPLPQITFTGVQNTTDPLQQPAIGIQLSSSYGSDLHGVLTLSFVPDSFVDDPAIEFVTGTRMLNFTVPANTTQAIFGQLGKSAPFQTGTLSGTISFSATFTAGAVDITPSAAPMKATVIPPGPPQLRSVRLGMRSGSTIQLLISGYSTTRSVSQLAFQFTAAAGKNLQTPTATADVGSAFTSWYANPSSDAFGSQFTVALTLMLTGDPAALQSISVTASNSQGTSPAAVMTLQ